MSKTLTRLKDTDEYREQLAAAGLNKHYNGNIHEICIHCVGNEEIPIDASPNNWMHIRMYVDVFLLTSYFPRIKGHIKALLTIGFP